MMYKKNIFFYLNFNEILLNINFEEREEKWNGQSEYHVIDVSEIMRNKEWPSLYVQKMVTIRSYFKVT